MDQGSTAASKPTRNTDQQLNIELSRFFQTVDADEDGAITENEYSAALDLASEILDRTSIHGQQSNFHKKIETVRTTLDAAMNQVANNNDHGIFELTVNDAIIAAQTMDEDEFVHSLAFVVDMLCTMEDATTQDGKVRGTKSNWINLVPAAILFSIQVVTNQAGPLDKTYARGPCSRALL
eukprot:COSAG01_NODE_4579_length_4904_cov_13.838710_9_plen_180_part_00